MKKGFLILTLMFAFISVVNATEVTFKKKVRTNRPKPSKPVQSGNGGGW